MSTLTGKFFSNRTSMEGKLAVITGAASGIGLEFSRRCVLTFGMYVVMADIDESRLIRETQRLNNDAAGNSSGGDRSGSSSSSSSSSSNNNHKGTNDDRATAVPMDVRQRSHFVRLLAIAQNATVSGCIDVCLFNAGVLGAGVHVLKGGSSSSSSSSESDWRWVLDVNLFGVLHGLQVFTPALSVQSRPALIAVTASDRGLDIGGTPGCTAGYAASKHGVIGMCESLEGELTEKGLLGRQIQLSVMCPGLVASSLWDAGRAEEQRDTGNRRTIAFKESRRRFMEDMGTSVSDTIDTFIEGMVRGQFICDSVPGQAQESFGRRAEYIMGGLMPSDRRFRMSML